MLIAACLFCLNKDTNKVAVVIIKNIQSLVNVRMDSYVLRGKELAVLPVLDNAYLIVEDGIIAEFGSMLTIPENALFIPDQIDATNKMIFPCWCDSHTHLVYAGSREHEFVAKIKGLSYAEIAANGGGILNSVDKLNKASEDDLFMEAWQRLMEVSRLGTGAIEIKSGYGLNVEGELKMLRVIKRLK